MKIGELSRRTNTNIETIRYYERIGLLPSPVRTGSNYRDFAESHRTRLTFIRHARELGFTIDGIRSLLDLADHPERDCGEADQIASRHLSEIEAKLTQLTALQNELQRIVQQCRGGSAGDCKVIEALADHRQCAEDHKVGKGPKRSPSSLPSSTATARPAC